MSENNNKKTAGKLSAFVLLHVLLVIYSADGVLSKFAGREAFLSPKFILYYGILIVLLGIYAIGWQQVIKRLPLTTAFANKAVTVVWGIIWGYLFFGEVPTTGKLIGSLMVITGVIIYAFGEKDASAEADTAKEDSNE